jgi:NAD(P)-dependent dehydrogenase (short-subunit alcohol dehydrogenase family)
MRTCIIITGASKGIGRAIAKEFDSFGFELLLIGRNESDLKSLQKELKSPSHILTCDFQSLQQVDHLVNNIQNFLDTGYLLKGIVNNAGIFKPQKSMDCQIELWVTQFQINLFAAVKLTECLISHLQKAQPSWILNISSTLATRPSHGVGAYGASKAAMNHWTQTLALELGPLGIRANCICPGIVDTPIHGFHHLPENEKFAEIQKMGSLQPLGRIGAPKDIAQAAKFLCSENAEWVTGAILSVDGGINLT